MRAVALQHPGGAVAMITHCDIIRAIVAGVLGLSLDHILRFDIAPAGVSRVLVEEWGERLVSLNELVVA
jgi:probable phosphoglycerate mutase